MKGIVTDNASNMVKAFRNAEQGASQQLLLTADEDELIRVGINCRTEDEFPTALAQRYGCLAHTLQLVVKDGLNESTTRITSLLKKCASLVSSIHRSCKAVEFLEENNVNAIPMQNATRWNSTFAMLNGLLKAEETCEGVLKKVGELISSSVLLLPKDLETLKELRGLLTYFAHATTLLEAENQPTSSLAIPTIVGLKKALYKAETHHTTSIKTGLQCAIQSQLSGFLSDDHSLSYWLLWINDVN